MILWQTWIKHSKQFKLKKASVPLRELAFCLGFSMLCLTTIMCVDLYKHHVDSDRPSFAAVVVLLVVFLKQRKPYLLLRPCDPIVAPVMNKCSE